MTNETVSRFRHEWVFSFVETTNNKEKYWYNKHFLFCRMKVHDLVKRVTLEVNVVSVALNE